MKIFFHIFYIFVSSTEIQKSCLHKHSVQLMYMLSLVFMINEVSQDFSTHANSNCEMLEAKKYFYFAKKWSHNHNQFETPKDTDKYFFYKRCYNICYELS